MTYEVNATYVDRDGKKYPAHLMAAISKDADWRPKMTDGNGKVVGNAVEEIGYAKDPRTGETIEAGMVKIPTQDLMVNFATPGAPARWNYVKDARLIHLTTRGPNVPPQPYYIPMEKEDVPKSPEPTVEKVEEPEPKKKQRR